MNEQQKEKWYYQTWSLVVSFLFIGPFMLPLVWMNPRFSQKTKLIISSIVIILTLVLTAVFAYSLKVIGCYYKTVFSGF